MESDTLLKSAIAQAEHAAPLRIAQIVGRYKAGGVEAVVMNYYRNIDYSKVQFDFIWDGYEDTPFDAEIKKLGGRVYKVTPYSKNIFKNMKEYYGIFSKNKYHIVHSHLNTLSVFPLLAAKLAGVPVRIAHNHSTAYKGEPKTMIKYILRPFAKIFPTHYFACSRYAGEWLFGKKCMGQGKVTVMPNAIDVEKYSFNPETRKHVRKELSLEGKLVVGHVGRFVYQKNHELLINIFNEIHKRQKNSVLLLAGDGPLLNKIRGKVDKLGLTDSVQFLGVRDDVAELLQAMDVFVLPSFYEGLGMVLIEAQAAELRCIVSDTVTREAKITDLVEFKSIRKPAEYWAMEIISYQKGNFDKKINKESIKMGFDIKKQSDLIKKHYLSF